MRFPLTEQQALILCKLINNDKLLQREMDPFDMVTLTQVGAIKRTNNENKKIQQSIKIIFFNTR